MNRRNYRACNLLTAVAVMRDKVEAPDAYPFSIPAIRALREIEFNEAVTFFIGENGSGKSTPLEAIAVRWGLNPESGSCISGSLPALRTSPKRRIVSASSAARVAFFLRAETYFNVATQIDRLDDEPMGGWAAGHQFLGRPLAARHSHGELFFALFMNHCGGGELYIPAEPEAALSPSRQPAF
jgi:predicted ATPase